jgi:hypothetical protein
MLLYTPVTPLIWETLVFFIFGGIYLIQFLVLMLVEVMSFHTMFPMKIR